MELIHFMLEQVNGLQPFRSMVDFIDGVFFIGVGVMMTCIRRVIDDIR